MEDVFKLRKDWETRNMIGCTQETANPFYVKFLEEDNVRMQRELLKSSETVIKLTREVDRLQKLIPADTPPVS